MTKWKTARYLIDAKKCIDSILYIARHNKSLCNIDLRKKTSSLLREFYINCCVVLDETHNKKELCCKSGIIKRIYYERDKDKAHKDIDYKPLKFNTFTELSSIMKKQIQEVYTVCSNVLPDSITLDYVPHDKELFRFVNAISPEKEQEILEKKHPLYGKTTSNNPEDIIVRKVFQDTEDIRNMSDDEKDNYAVIIEDGLNWYEGLQNRQDSMIKLNVLSGYNAWCSIKKGGIELITKWTLLGLLDVYSIPQLPNANNKEACEEVRRIFGGLLYDQI